MLIGDTVTYDNTGTGNICIGSNITLTGTTSNRVAIGASAAASNANVISIGGSANSTGANCIAIGLNALASTGRSICIGSEDATPSSASVSNQNSVGIGNGVNVTVVESVAIGCTDTGGTGNRTSVTGSRSVAIGSGTSTSGTNSIIIGTGSSNAGNNAIVLGRSMTGIANQMVVGTTGTTWWQVGPVATVTQITSNNTDVTINSYQGVITMFGTLTTGTNGTFTVNNSDVLSTSCVICTAFGGTSGRGIVTLTAVSNGSFRIRVYAVNDTIGNDLTTPKVHFCVFN